MKKRSERCKHCALAVARWSQKFLPRRRRLSRECRTAKIYSAGDGHYLYLQTQFGEDRCTQFRVIVVTDRQINTHRQDRLQYTAPLSLVRSVINCTEMNTGAGAWRYSNLKARNGRL